MPKTHTKPKQIVSNSKKQFKPKKKKTNTKTASYGHRSEDRTEKRGTKLFRSWEKMRERKRRIERGFYLSQIKRVLRMRKDGRDSETRRALNGVKWRIVSLSYMQPRSTWSPVRGTRVVVWLARTKLAMILTLITVHIVLGAWKLPKSKSDNWIKKK